MSGKYPLCAPVSDIRVLSENAQKRTGSFAPVISSANVRLGLERGLSGFGAVGRYKPFAFRELTASFSTNALLIGFFAESVTPVFVDLSFSDSISSEWSDIATGSTYNPHCLLKAA